MKEQASLIALVLLAGSVAAAPQTLQSLDRELSRLHVHTALVIPAPQVEDHPLWSPASDRLAASVGGRWQIVELGRLMLQEGKWPGGLRIGVIASASSISESEPPASWRKVSRYDPRRIQMKSGLTIELRAGGDELSTSLVVTRPGKPSKVVWSSDRESCHSLVAALDDQHVAFICEGNGVFVMRPDDVP